MLILSKPVLSKAEGGNGDGTTHGFQVDALLRTTTVEVRMHMDNDPVATEGRYSCARRTRLAVEVRTGMGKDPVAYGGMLFVRTAHATQD